MCGLNTPECCALPGTVTTCFSGATTTCCNGFNNCNRVTSTPIVSYCYVGGTYMTANGYVTTQNIAQQACVSPKNKVDFFKFIFKSFWNLFKQKNISFVPHGPVAQSVILLVPIYARITVWQVTIMEFKWHVVKMSTVIFHQMQFNFCLFQKIA